MNRLGGLFPLSSRLWGDTPVHQGGVHAWLRRYAPLKNTNFFICACFSQAATPAVSETAGTSWRPERAPLRQLAIFRNTGKSKDVSVVLLALFHKHFFCPGKHVPQALPSGGGGIGNGDQIGAKHPAIFAIWCNKRNSRENVFFKVFLLL